jgi:hypothetical protein
LVVVAQRQQHHHPVVIVTLVQTYLWQKVAVARATPFRVSQVAVVNRVALVVAVVKVTSAEMDLIIRAQLSKGILVIQFKHQATLAGEAGELGEQQPIHPHWAHLSR